MDLDEGGEDFSEKWAILCVSGQNPGWPDFKSFDHNVALDSSPESKNEPSKVEAGV